ncbi:MAG: rRNA maturation RNase YbeY [Chlamydiales bacterium]|nr:rRNA maturation RNase YbeY [Chlamydiales bacterium]
MIIQVYNRQSDLVIHDKAVKALVKEILRLYDVQCKEVNIFFVPSEELCDLHETFFNDPSPTDCITFPMDDPKDANCEMLGEVFICPATALQYAEEHRLSAYEELSLYVVHGLLHLIGFDDIEEKEEAIMRQEEKRCLVLLKKENLLLKKENVIEKR